MTRGRMNHTGESSLSTTDDQKERLAQTSVQDEERTEQAAVSGKQELETSAESDQLQIPSFTADLEAFARARKADGVKNQQSRDKKESVRPADHVQTKPKKGNRKSASGQTRHPDLAENGKAREKTKQKVDRKQESGSLEPNRKKNRKPASKTAGSRQANASSQSRKAAAPTLEVPVLSAEDTMYGQNAQQPRVDHPEFTDEMQKYIQHGTLYDSPAEKQKRLETAKELFRMDEEARKSHEKPVPDPAVPKSRMWKLLHNPWIYVLGAAAVCMIWLTADMLRLGLYPFSTLLMTAGLGMLVLALAVFLFYYQKKWFGILAALGMCICVSVCSVMGVQQNNRMISEIQKMVSSQDAITNAAGIYYLKQAPVNSIENLNNTNVGILSVKNQDLTQRAIDALKEQGISVKKKSYDSFTALIRALKGQAVRAVILSSADPLLASEFTGLENTPDELGLLESFPVDEPRYNTGVQKNLRTEPFTMLVSVVNENMKAERFRSWLTMAVAMDPVTRTALCVYIPRSMRLPYACEEETGCAHGTEDKISLAGYQSVLTLRDTVSQALNIPIDFTVKISAEKLASSLDPRSTIPLTSLEGLSSLPLGEDQKAAESIDGVRARRAFSSINDFSASDMDYERSQLDLMVALISGMMQGVAAEREAGLELMADCVQTNLSYDQLLSLLQIFIRSGRSWDVYGCGIQGKESWDYSSSLAAKTFMLEPSQDSLHKAAADLQAVLDGQKPASASGMDAWQTESPVELDPENEEKLDPDTAD